MLFQEEDEDVRGRSARAAWLCLSDAVELLERAGMNALAASCHGLLERLEESMDEAQLVAIRVGLAGERQANDDDDDEDTPAPDASVDDEPTWPRSPPSRTL